MNDIISTCRVHISCMHVFFSPDDKWQPCEHSLAWMNKVRAHSQNEFSQDLCLWLCAHSSNMKISDGCPHEKMLKCLKRFYIHRHLPQTSWYIQKSSSPFLREWTRIIMQLHCKWLHADLSNLHVLGCGYLLRTIQWKNYPHHCVSVSPFELKFTTYQTSVITTIAVDTALNIVLTVN